MESLLGCYIWLAARVAEPSTHASLSAMAGMLGMNLETGILHHLAVLASLGFGAMGFWLKEKGPLTKVPQL